MLALLINFGIMALIVYLIVKAVKKKNTSRDSSYGNQNYSSPNPIPPNAAIDKLAVAKFAVANMHVDRIKAKYPGIMDDFPYERFLDESKDPSESEDELSKLASDVYEANPDSVCRLFDFYHLRAIIIKDEDWGNYWINISRTILERVANTYRSTKAYEELLTNMNGSLYEIEKAIAPPNSNRSDVTKLLSSNTEFTSLLQRRRFYLDKYVELVLSGNYDGYLKELIDNEPDLEHRPHRIARYNKEIAERNNKVAIQLISTAYNSSSIFGADSLTGRYLSVFLREKAELMEIDYLKKAIQISQLYFFNESDLFKENTKDMRGADCYTNRFTMSGQESTLALCYYHGLGVQQNREHASAFYQRVKRVADFHQEDEAAQKTMQDTAQRIKELCPEI